MVPRDVIPVYCESMFPKSHGAILDFMHVYDGDMVAFLATRSSGCQNMRRS